ncbi:MAG: sodium-independent anion transporter [Betaproteobacteria bacterium RIFCSPLOWO2_12_FULL_64_23]|nr:MAG: sodium-independent anion transporter [Betaproteobacteria bacterium RIFCSPLOWO2_12_FULL_64_23]
MFPFLGWPRPSKKTLSDDVLAGITVALVVIPQSLAYAQLAGVPAYYGLYASLLPAIVGALFGSSAQLSTGPVAMTSLLTAASIAPLAPLGSDAFIAHAVLLALLSGLFQVGFGVLRMGIAINLLSQPVLMGFINAAAIIIALAQLPPLVGMSSRQTAHFLLDTWQVIVNLDLMHEISLVFGAGAIAMLLGFRRYAPKLPGVLITAGLLTAISYAIGFAELGGRVVGAIPSGVPEFVTPVIDWETTKQLLPAAFVIALISFMEAMSSCKVIAIKTKRPWNENQELIGQGLAKIAAAFNNTMPVSGSFSRSALNLQSDARSGLSSVVTAMFVLLTLLFFTPLLYHLPKPVLAAIIMLAVFNLLNFQSFRRAWQARRDDGIAAVITFATTLLFAPNIQDGILSGIIVSLSLHLYRGMRPRIAIASLHEDGTLRDAERFGLQPVHDAIGIVRLDASLNFVTAAALEDAVLKLERDKPRLKFILLTASGINDLDATGAELLFKLSERLSQNGITLALSAAKKQVLDVIGQTGLDTAIGRGNIYATDRLAVDGLLARVGA